MDIVIEENDEKSLKLDKKECKSFEVVEKIVLRICKYAKAKHPVALAAGKLTKALEEIKPFIGKQIELTQMPKQWAILDSVGSVAP